MKLPRRTFLQLTAGAAALPVVSRVAWTQSYPTRPIRWIVPYPAGGSADVVARLVGQFVSERLNQSIVVENRTGAGANIGTEAVAKSPPDGHTLLFITTANAINVSFYPNLSFNFNRDIVPIAGLVRLPIVVEVHPSVPVKTVAEFINYAKANPGKINYASSGIGTSGHLAAELFKSMTGVQLTHVPYRGVPPALTDLVSGRVQAMFDNLFTSIEHIKAGKLHLLAMATATRLDVLPDIPTVAETVPGYEASSIFGVGVPTGTGVDIITTLNTQINAALGDPAIRSRLIELSSVPIPSTPQEFRDEVAATTEKWGNLIRRYGIKPEG